LCRIRFSSPQPPVLERAVVEEAQVVPTAIRERSVPQNDHQNPALCSCRECTEPIIPQINPAALSSTPKGARNASAILMNPWQTAAEPKPKDARFTDVGPLDTVGIILLLPVII
jgi:hypothetical protein